MNISQLTDFLKTTNLAKNTIIDFVSKINILAVKLNLPPTTDILNNPEMVINCLETHYTNLSTRQTYLACILSLSKLLHLPENYIEKYENTLISLRAVTLSNKKKFTKPSIERAKIMKIFSYDDLFVIRDKLKSELPSEYNRMSYNDYLLVEFHCHLPPLRADEYFSITYNNVCLSPNYINVDTKQIIIAEHKTKKTYGVKIINIPQDLFDIILHIRQLSNSEWLFPGYDNNFRLNSSNVYRIWKRIIGIDHISCDILRNLFVSEKIPSLTDEERVEISRIMGHSLDMQTYHYSQMSKILHKNL